VELRDYLKVLRKQWRLIALCVLLAAGTAALVTVQSTPQYRTTVTFFVSTPGNADANSAYTGGLFSQQRVKSYASILASPTTAAAVSTAAPGTTPEGLVGHITAAAVPDTVLLKATVSDPSPVRALEIARGVATAFPQVVRDLEARDPAAAAPIKASVVEQPTLPAAPFSPQPTRNLALAVVLGLLLGVGLAVLRETLDNSVKSADDIQAATGAATLGAIGYDAKASTRPLIVHDNPRNARSEAFRQLRTNLQFVQVDGSLRSMVITSSVPQEGKSTTACNLAITLAQAGVRVCLVEGDLRRPRVADYLGLEGAVGVTNVLIGQRSLDAVLQPWGNGMLEVLASGPLPPNPSELLSSHGMGDLMEALERRFDVVVVDAPPLLPVTDAAILSTLASGAVLCVRSRRTRKEQLSEAAGALRAVDAKILGVVLNMVPTSGPDAYHGYGYGYGSYNSDGKKPQLSEESALRGIQVPPSTREPAVHDHESALERR